MAATFNPLRRLAALFPPEPLMLAQVVELDIPNNLSRVEYPQGTPLTSVAPGVSLGSTQWVRGSSLPVDSWVWVRGGTIESEAPGGDVIQVEIGGPKDGSFDLTPFSWNGPVPAQNIALGAAFSLAILPYCAGGTEPYTLALVAGTVPPGITLSLTTFLLGGIATAAGTYGATFAATDADGVTVQTGYVRIKVS